MKSPQSEGGLDAGTFAGAAGWNDGILVLTAATGLEAATEGGPATLGIAPLPGGGGKMPTLPLPTT